MSELCERFLALTQRLQPFWLQLTQRYMPNLLLYHRLWSTEGQHYEFRMYTAGLNPFYASNFSLWSAYCAGGFAMDTMKKPSFCIADILQVGDAENIPGSSALMTHMGHRSQVHASGSPLRPSPVGPEQSIYGGRVNPGSPYHRHGIHLTSVSRTSLSSQQAPPPSSKDLKFGIDRILSTDFDPKTKDISSLRGMLEVHFSLNSLKDLMYSLHQGSHCQRKHLRMPLCCKGTFL